MHQKIVGYDDAADVVEEVFCDVWKRKEAIDLGDKIHSSYIVPFIHVVST